MKIIKTMLLVILLATSIPALAIRDEMFLEVDNNEPYFYALSIVGAEFSLSQWTYFDDLIRRESNWDCEAQNPTSTAYGCGQFLDSTWKSVGYTKTSDPLIQLDATIDYIIQRHKTPRGAIVFHNANNSY